MDRSTPFLLPVFLFLFLFLLLPFLPISSFVATNHNPNLGFLYTRTRGRCTPQFWSARREEWPKMVPQTSTISKVFGSRVFERYRQDLTLLESTARNDEENVFARLLKQASAALLNSYSRKGYPYSPWEIKTMLIQGLISEDAAACQARKFYLANQACN